MCFSVLGPVHVRSHDVPTDIGGRHPRLILGMLLAARGRPVTADALIEAAWAGTPPRSAVGTVQSYISRLRRLVEQVDGARLVHEDAGYRLDAPADVVDFRRFEALAEDGRAVLEADPAQAAALLSEALALWGGPAFGDLTDHPALEGTAVRLEEGRLVALESRLDADLRCGRHASVVGELTELVRAHPLREGLRALLAVALYRAGRQADALAALADARRTLRDELGVDPGPRLQEVEAAILAHGPSLQAPSPTAEDISAVRDRSRSATSPRQPARPPLVGRHDELAALMTALDEATEDARFIVIEGEPGIGKTRLAEELRAVALARGCTVVMGRADESGAAPALWPWLPILRAVTDDEWVASLDITGPDAVGFDLPTGHGAAARFERFEAIAGRLETAGADRPLVVLLDDLQWADATSLALLAFLATRLTAGVLVAGTVRVLEIGRSDPVTAALAAIARRPGSRRLALRGLSELDTAALLGSLDIASSVQPSVQRIHARAEGNPFYAIELARLLAHDQGSGAEVPGSVRDVIRRRLDHLPPATLELLTLAAVTGRDVDPGLLAQAAGRPLLDCVHDLDPAITIRLLVDVGRAGLRFSHALVREVLLDGVTSLQRARLHLAVADAMQQRGVGHDEVELLAEHLWRAAPLGVAHRAAQASEAAAEVAIRRVAYGAAEELLRRSAQLRRSGGMGEGEAAQRAELAVLVRLLEVVQATRYFPTADLTVVARAQELAEALGLSALHLRLAWVEWSSASTAVRVDAARAVSQAIAARTRSAARPELRSLGHAVTAITAWTTGRITDAVSHIDEAARLVEGAPAPADRFEDEQRLLTVTFQLHLHALHGDWTWDRVHAGFIDAMDRYPAAAKGAVCAFAASAANAMGRLDSHAVVVARALDAEEATRFPFWGGALLMHHGIALARAGRLDEGLAAFAEGDARYLSTGARSSLAGFRASIAMLAARAGRREAAEDLLAGARDADLRQERWNEPIVLLAEGVVAHAAGAAHAAVTRWFADARAEATRQGSHGLAARAEAEATALGLSLPAAEPA